MASFGLYFLFHSVELSLGDAVNATPVFLTLLGLVLLAVGFLGCWGVLKLNRCLLIMFAGTVLTIIIGEIICGVLLIFNKGKIRESVIVQFTHAIKQIEGVGDKSLEDEIKKIQNKFNCCGAIKPSDWMVPSQRCCKEGESNCTIFPAQGCVDAIDLMLKNRLVIVGVAMLILAVFEVGALAVAVCAIMKDEEEEEEI
ncbi:hypothetical protein Aperf_G00000129737 [Anoplocephala perfoliata]